LLAPLLLTAATEQMPEKKKKNIVLIGPTACGKGKQVTFKL
jgi:ATP-dependent protease Clp ATPase subunit